ncbi:hypothetical protein AGLY_015447 [Aphis glycines]|uniref:Uncharacterized protein n=1 Tax=Aphis glycines TaxID=307491 RepID=A0A6G0T0Q0_APHGL|nr:hypothetical protein AGLY_015447 [Aphis glycines]
MYNETPLISENLYCFSPHADDYSTPNNLDEIKFKMNMVCMQCLYWKDGAWSSKGLEIGHNSSVDGNVQCYAYHLSMFKSSIFVIPDLINPFDEIHLFSTIANNMVCLILVSIIFILYFVLLYWSSVNDKNDIFKNRVIILDDNHMGEDEVYLVTVYTGHWLGSGTTANVCIELNGTICKSRVAIDIAFSLAITKSSVVHPGVARAQFIRCSSDCLLPHSQVSGPSWCPHLTMLTLVLNTPALSLFIVFHMGHGWFSPKIRSSGGTGVSSLHLRNRIWSIES